VSDTVPSPYDPIAWIYDPWSRSVVEDVEFYVVEARKAVGRAGGGQIVELGVGTGRIAIPVAQAGVPVIGVDSSAAMLEVCLEHAREAGVDGLLDLREGDLRDPPVEERVPLVACPFRAYLHMETDADRRAALAAAYRLLLPGGGVLAFDVFAPAPDDIADTNGRWIEREPGIWERADWDEEERRLSLSVRDDERSSTMTLAWISAAEWRTLLEESGFEIEACYGWFDRRPFTGGEDSIWLARRP
jgi:SAM-dependent methyltransferase